MTFRRSAGYLRTFLVTTLLSLALGQLSTEHEEKKSKTGQLNVAGGGGGGRDKELVLGGVADLVAEETGR